MLFRRPALAVALLLVAALALIHPNVESGLNDDWSYVRTAHDLAATGQLRYNGWAAPVIGLQAYWAAAFIKVFGFSFFVTRLSVWVLAIITIPVLSSLLHLVGLSRSRTLLCLGLFLFSPVVLPNLSTFMTDMPAFFLFAASLFCGLKAWHATADRALYPWLAGVAVFTMLSGSVRQIYWLSGICILAAFAWKRLPSNRGRAFIVACILAISAFGAWTLNWLSHQRYVPTQNLIAIIRAMPPKIVAHEVLVQMSQGFVELALLCLPLTLPLAFREVKRIRIWVQCPIWICSLGISYWLADPVPWLGNIVTNYGVTISNNISYGEKPAILPDTFMLLLATLALAAACYAWQSGHIKQWSKDPFALLTVPFLFFYTLILCSRAPTFGLFDRYFIPHLFVLLVFTLRMNPAGALSRLTLILGCTYAIYALATTHDYFAEGRAKTQAAEEIMRAGISRTSIMAGFEFDSWTQVDQAGYVNDPSVKSYRQTENCNGPDDANQWWRSMTPAIQGRYVVTLTHLEGMLPSEFPALPYRRWLPRGEFHVLIEKPSEADAPLVCEPGPGF